MTEKNPADEEHEGGGQISPPEEPFAHMTNHSFFGVNSPVFLTLFGIGLGLFGLWAIGLGVVRFGRTGQGEHLMALVVGLPFVALGAFASFMGVQRMRWKREYERVMGRSPFQ